MLHKLIDELVLDDVVSLVTNKVPESKTLEYKSALKLDKDNDKKEFLFDISSFANAMGGDIIYGIAEAEKGLPGAVAGIEGNVDEWVRKIEQLIRDSVMPAILNIKIKAITTDADKFVLIIRIQRSFSQPHQVTYQKTDKFYSRSNSGKYRMDIHELREAFLLSDTLVQRIKQFVRDRVVSIQSGDTPFTLDAVPKMILHVIPLASVDTSGTELELNELENSELFPLGSTGYDKRINLEGVIKFRTVPGQKLGESYIQLYRNGIIETVNADLLRPWNNKKQILAGGEYSFEYHLLRTMLDIMNYLKAIGIPAPVYGFSALTGVKGYTIGSSIIHESVFGTNQIDRENLSLPEMNIASYDDDIEKKVKQWIDLIWNACGYQASFTFDKNNYIKQLRKS